jgi:hypothetical protein
MHIIKNISMMVVLVDWACRGEAGDTGIKDWEAYLVSPASPLRTKNEHTDYQKTSGIICYTQNNK